MKAFKIIGIILIAASCLIMMVGVFFASMKAIMLGGIIVMIVHECVLFLKPKKKQETPDDILQRS